MERNMFWDAQPVPIMQQRCNMVVFLAVPYQSCCRVKHWLQTILEASRYSDLSATAPTRWRERIKLADWRNDGCCVSVAELQNSWIQSVARESSWTCCCPEIFPDREQTLQAWQAYLRRQKMDHSGQRCCWRFEAHHSTSVWVAFSCKRLDAIHLSTSLMHMATLFCRAWVLSGEQKPFICVSSV